MRFHRKHYLGFWHRWSEWRSYQYDNRKMRVCFACGKEQYAPVSSA